MGTTTRSATIRGHIYSWSHAVDLQSKRVLASKSNIDWQADIELFAIALRNLHRAVDWAKVECDVTRDGERSRKLHAAIRRFDEAIPDAVQVRDLLEHFDAYGRGKGEHPKLGSYKFFTKTAESAQVYVAGYELDVVAATGAAVRFANEALKILSV